MVAQQKKPATKTAIKGVIIAGGEGTRLRPLTYAVNKQLLPVYNKPLIYYPIQTLKDAGVTDIVLVSHRHWLGQFIDILGAGEELGVNLNYTVQDKPLGLAHALNAACHFVRGSKVAFLLGDNIFAEQFKPFVDAFLLKEKGAALVLKHTDDVELLQRSGVAELDTKHSRIVGIEEKPQKPKSNMLVTGFTLYDERVFDFIAQLKPSVRGEYEFTDLNNFYVREGTMGFVETKERWIDAGTFDSLLEASNYMAERFRKGLQNGVR